MSVEAEWEVKVEATVEGGKEEERECQTVEVFEIWFSGKPAAEPPSCGA